MSYLKHLRHQIPTIAALGRTVLGVAQAAVTSRRATSTDDLGALAPGKHHYALLPPPDAGLIADFVTHLGGDPAIYDGQVPAHLFPQWTFPILTETLKDLPIATHRLLNGGFRLEIKGQLPQGEALEIEAWLEAIDDDPRKTRLTQRIVTGTASSPEALTVDFFPVVPKKRGKSRAAGAPDADEAQPTASEDPMRDPRVRPEIPTEGLEVLGTVELSDRAGLEFALLTGDFNFIHWLKPAARASGFKNVILHGFSSAGRALEAYVRERLDGDPTRVRVVTARFNKPLVLPATGTIWADAHGSVWLGKAQGEKSWMSAHIVAD